MQPKKISMLKSVTWRLLGIGLLALITWMVTQDLITTTLVTITHHVAFIFIYYFHERVWEGRVQRGKPFIKAFIYEIVLGFLVLSVITFVVTGSWKAMTDITLLYLGLRVIGYPIHEWFYARSNRRGKTH